MKKCNSDRIVRPRLPPEQIADCFGNVLTSFDEGACSVALFIGPRRSRPGFLCHSPNRISQYFMPVSQNRVEKLRSLFQPGHLLKKRAILFT